MHPLFSPNPILIMWARQQKRFHSSQRFVKSWNGPQAENPGQRVKAGGRDKFWFVILAVIFTSCVALYFLITSKAVSLAPTSVSIAERILRGAALIVVLLAIARTTSVYGLARIEDASTRFTLQRVARLVVALVIAVIVVSIIFVNWYGALAALGIGPVIIGLALQHR